MKNPVEELVEWFTGQEETIQDEIGHMVTMIHPFFSEDDDFGDPDVFRDTLEDLVDESYLKGLGFVMAFKAVFDYLFQDRNTDESWERVKQNLLKVLELDLDEDRENAEEIINEKIAEIPARKEMWTTVCASWSEFSDAYLSHEYLKRWSRHQIMVQTSAV